MNRTIVLQKLWDNGQQCTDVREDDDGVIYCNAAWAAGPKVQQDLPDDSGTESQDVYALDTGGRIFDLDVPGCSAQFHFYIQHTSENYVNYNQYARVQLVLNTPYTTCSDMVLWSYQARVDSDAGTVPKNELKLQHIPEADMISHFTPR